MSKHTPGPWRLLPEEADRAYVRVRGTIPGGRYKVANIVTPTYHGAPPREAEETRANARLIAAAPDLLESLAELLDALDQNGSCSYERIREAGRAAIAKALGAA